MVKEWFNAAINPDGNLLVNHILCQSELNELAMAPGRERLEALIEALKMVIGRMQKTMM